MHARAIQCLAVLLLVPFLVPAQAPPPRAGFDVISVKRNLSDSRSEVTPPLQHGRLRFTNVTVQAIMSVAFYPLNFDQIKGAPDWTSISTGTRYDIEATTQERPVTEERYHQMLQKMLEDRFRLKFHWETHDEPVYLLVADKKGLKLKTTDPASCTPVPPDTTFAPNGTACGRSYGFTRAGNGLHFEGIGMTTKTLAVVLRL
ncbi:MAG TPA: TIGR03435 family protein, partial [Bryobacteraceae bacterium]